MFAASAPAGGLRRVETPPHVAACEVMEDERIVLVFAVLASRELLELLWGEAFERRIRHRGGERLTHGRWRGRGLGIRSGGAGGGRYRRRGLAYDLEAGPHSILSRGLDDGLSGHAA